MSYVRPRYSRVAVDARVAGYLCVAGYPCLSLMAQVLLFLDVRAIIKYHHASKIPQCPNAVERSAAVLDAVIFQQFVFLAHVPLRFGGAGKGIQWVTSHCIKGPEGVIQRSLSKEVRRINSDLKGSGSGSFISMAITISPSDGFCCLASIHLFIYDSFIVHALG